MTLPKEPFWARGKPRRKHDIKHLRPASYRRGERFETPQDARRYSCSNQSQIQGATELEDLAEALHWCRASQERCGEPFCPICARRYRRWLIGRTLPFFHPADGPAFFVTLHIEERPPGKLAEIDLVLIKRRLRTRMGRALPPGAIAIGGIEVNLTKGLWVVHVHLAILGAEKSLIARLAGSPGRTRALDIRRLRHPVKQVSYLQKFTTYHRPGQQTGPSRSRAYPLPRRECRELASWMAGHAFEDFLILHGVRRRGPRIVCESA